MNEPDNTLAAWREVLTEAYLKHARLLFRLAFNILRDADAAEDVCQQALATACAARFALNRPRAVRPWLARVVVNESLRLLRRRKVEQRHALHVRADARLPLRPADPLVREQVLEAVARLPEPNRVVVLLRVMQGLSGNEVKEIVGCSAAEVSRRLQRGMDQLRVLLADFNTTPPTVEFRYGS